MQLRSKLALTLVVIACLLIADGLGRETMAADDTQSVTAIVEIAPSSGVSLEVSAAPDEVVLGRRPVRVTAVVSSEIGRYESLQAEVFFDQSGLQLSGPAERSLPTVVPNLAHRATWALNSLETGVYVLTVEVHGVDEQGSPVATTASATVHVVAP